MTNFSKGLKGFQLPLNQTNYAENIFWVFGLVAESEELCLNVIEALTKENIGTRPFFWCMHKQPVYEKMGLFKGEKYPIAEKMATNGFYLPSGLGLSNDQIDLVSEKLLNFLNK